MSAQSHKDKVPVLEKKQIRVLGHRGFFNMMMKQNDVILSILCQGHCGKGLVSIAKALHFPPQQPCNIDHVSKAFKKMSHFICLVLFTANLLKPCFFPHTLLIVFRICIDENGGHAMAVYYLII